MLTISAGIGFRINEGSGDDTGYQNITSKMLEYIYVRIKY